MDVEKSVYICTERLRGTQSKLPTFVYKCMEKKEKIMSVEDSFVSSDCSVFEISIKKWYDAEFERLAAKGKDTSKFHLFSDPDINEGSVCCEDYIMKFNRDEGVIDLVVNGEEDSFIWDNVIHCVLSQFASCFGNPKNFLYRVSSNTSEEKKFYGCAKISDVDVMLPINGFTAIEAWKAENFDSLISSMYNIF